MSPALFRYCVRPWGALCESFVHSHVISKVIADPSVRLWFQSIGLPTVSSFAILIAVPCELKLADRWAEFVCRQAGLEPRVCLCEAGWSWVIRLPSWRASVHCREEEMKECTKSVTQWLKEYYCPFLGFPWLLDSYQFFITLRTFCQSLEGNSGHHLVVPAWLDLKLFSSVIDSTCFKNKKKISLVLCPMLWCDASGWQNREPQMDAGSFPLLPPFQEDDSCGEFKLWSIDMKVLKYFICPESELQSFRLLCSVSV